MMKEEEVEMGGDLLRNDGRGDHGHGEVKTDKSP